MSCDGIAFCTWIYELTMAEQLVLKNLLFLMLILGYHDQISVTGIITTATGAWIALLL